MDGIGKFTPVREWNKGWSKWRYFQLILLTQPVLRC